MFFELLRKELGQVIKCTTYYILFLCILLFYYTQLGEFEMIQEPVPGQEDYGYTVSKDKKVIMDKAIQSLFREYGNNNYGTYPIGFYKEVTLDEEEQEEMLAVMKGATDQSQEEIKEYFAALISNYNTADQLLEVTASGSISYEDFKVLMKRADQLLGGGSNYSEAYLLSNARVPKTYEDVLQEYKDIIEKDHLSGAYARLLCDYLGIVLTILPVFLAVTRMLRDKRAKANQIIYVRKVTSRQLVLSRYLAMLLAVLLPVMIIALILTVQCAYNGAGAGIEVDYFAFAKYILGWLLPGIMIVIAIGIFFTELTESAIAILIQGIWWFVSIFTGTAKINGGYGWNLIPRHNVLGGYELHHSNFNTLILNRMTYAIAAVALVVITIFIYERKRKGMLRLHGTMASNRKDKHKI